MGTGWCTMGTGRCAAGTTGITTKTTTGKATGNQYERGDEAQTRRARRAPEGSAAEVCGCAEAIAPRPPLQPHTNCGAHATACARQSGRRTSRVGRAAFARPTCAVLTLRVRTRARSANPNQHKTPATSGKPPVTGEICAPGGIRTPNLLIRSQMLYPLSYGRLGTSTKRFTPAQSQRTTTGAPHAPQHCPQLLAPEPHHK